MTIPVMSLASRIATLRTMTVAQLQHEYRTVFGEDTTSKHKEFLWRKIAWGLQANAEGGLPDATRQRALTLANPLHLRVRPPRETTSPRVASPASVGMASPTPAPGTVLTRRHRGVEHVVHVLAEGFEYQGTVFRSLTAVAEAITGSHCSGKAFFGLTGKGRTR
jgi:hypothetical protein